MTPSNEPPRDVLPPGVTERVVTIEVDAESLEGLRKRAETAMYGGHVLFSDEATGPGGGSPDPPPMIYFAATILF